MYTVAIYNFKGGAGKSTVTTHLAAGLALSGKRVLVVDTDPQGHASLLFGIKPQPKLYDWIVRPESTQFKDAAMLVPPEQYTPNGMESKNKGMVAVIPGNDETSFIPLKIRNPKIMRQRLAAVDKLFDVCLIDTPPTPTLLSVLTYVASDGVLYPTMCADLHIDGLVRAMEAREEAAAIRASMGLPDIDVIGIQPCIYRMKTLEHEEYLTWLKSQYADVWSPISQSVLWEEAARARQPVFMYAPETGAAKQAWQMVKTFHERVIA